MSTVIFHDPLTTWQAAALLGSQVQYVNKLLDDGEISFIQDGRLRLIRLSDAIAHKQKLSELGVVLRPLVGDLAARTRSQAEPWERGARLHEQSPPARAIYMYRAMHLAINYL